MMRPRVVALVAAYNESDIIEQTTSDLIEQGIAVYLLDDGSTDGTPDRLQRFVGRGVLKIERLEEPEAEGPSRFRLSTILTRKEQLAATLDADWFINHDADELRESPWPARTLVDGIELVDRLGWNAIDFEVLNFLPTDDRYKAGAELRSAFRFFEPGAVWDRPQVRAWKKQPKVDLRSNAGHDVAFEGRRVFPIRFLLRHYPIRSQAHGERKVFGERVPRFDADERARGWHMQYDQIDAGYRFLRDAESLTAYDAEAAQVNLQLHHRGVDELQAAAAAEQARLADEIGGLNAQLAEQREHIARLQDALAALERQRDALTAAAIRTAAHVEQLNQNARQQQEALAAACADAAHTHHQLAAARHLLAALYTSRSWRWTAGLRYLFGLLKTPPGGGSGAGNR